MAVKTHALFYKGDDGDWTNICVQIVHFFCWVQCLGVTFAALYFYIKPNCMIMKRMLNRMLRYADAIVKRGVDKLITRVRDNILKSKEQKTIQPTKGGHKMVTYQNYVSLFYCQITSCPSDGGIS